MDETSDIGLTNVVGYRVQKLNETLILCVPCEQIEAGGKKRTPIREPTDRKYHCTNCGNTLTNETGGSPDRNPFDTPPVDRFQM